MYLKMKMNKFMNNYLNKILGIKSKLEQADAIVIGAGAGLSTAAGLIYNGERFKHYFFDFEEKYGFTDMYSGGFYPYKTLEEYWGYWCRYIYINRYLDVPGSVYQNLLNLVKDKNYFVLTTNVDHCFQRTGFDKQRLFYTQGDYGLFQCSEPCHNHTYDNEGCIRNMILSEGFKIENNTLIFPENRKPEMKVSKKLIPYCPRCNKLMTMNLRADNTFVEDKGWYAANKRYEQFIRQNENKNIVFLELGVGYNTPGIIKYPFWKMTKYLPNASYICINQNEDYVIEYIKNKSICLKEDINKVLNDLL